MRATACNRRCGARSVESAPNLIYVHVVGDRVHHKSPLARVAGEGRG
jgi:hypothetical protein